MNRQPIRRMLSCLLCAGLWLAPAALRAGKNPAENLWESAEKAMEARNFAEALRLYGLSLAQCQGDLECQGANLNGMARAWEELGDNGKARHFYEESLKIDRRRGDPGETAIDLLSLGVVLSQSFDQPGQALPLLEESVALFRQAGRRADAAQAQYHLGVVKDILGRHADAVADLEQALAGKRALRDEAGTASVLAYLGSAYNQVGDYEKAGLTLDEAVASLRRLKNPGDLAGALNSKGLNDLDRHRLDQSMASFEEALRLGLQQADPSPAAKAMINLGGLHASQGQYDQARALFEQALALGRRLGRKAIIATALNNLGQTDHAMGRYDQAIAQYQAALALNRELGRRAEASIGLNNVAMSYDAMQRYDEAIGWHQQVLEADRQMGDPRAVARSLSNIGAAWMWSGQYGKAETAFLERKGMQGRLKGARLRNPGLTELYLLTGRPGQALALLGAEQPEAFADEPAVAEYLTQLGRAQAALGQLGPASGNLLKACTILEGIRSGTSGREAFLGGGAAGGRFRSFRALAAVLAERALKGEPMDPPFRPYGDSLAAAGFYFSEATKARALIEQLAESGRAAALGAALPPALKREEGQLRGRMAALAGERDQAARLGSAAFARNREQRAALAREIDGFVSRLRKEQPVYAAVAYPRPVPAALLPLDEHELLLAYGLGEEASYLFSVRRGGEVKVARINLARPALEERVKAFLAPLNARRPEAFSPREGLELYQLLLAEGLKGAGPDERVVLVPDGILGTLPFEILVTRAGAGAGESAYVAEQRAFTYYQSAALLALKRTLPAARAARPLFALGNPDFSSAAAPGPAFRGIALRPPPGGAPMAVPAAAGAPARVEFPALPETEGEVRAIAALMGVPARAPDILLGREACEQEVRKAPLESYRILHWATHAALAGLIQDINEPFLLLSQRERTPDCDGFLTLSEVLGLKLNADLVMLSACVTGLGRNVEGEGVANFARAFQSAGARRVVVSLWEVASDPAVAFAVLFYTGLREGKGHAEAFHAAQAALRGRYPNPYYWGVFILHGEV